MNESEKAAVTTVPEMCRVCYACVRECPAKAIRIIDGQAKILDERCIGCGNCVRVCSQGAKCIVSAIDSVQAMLEDPRPTVALVAPSFPAEFQEMEYGAFVGTLRALGFDWIHEVSFGADLVAKEYAALMDNSQDQRWVATTCPSVVQYIEKYRPELVECLVPIVSPMVASARIARSLHGPDINTVFIGPCSAKKCESADQPVIGEINAALTFGELREMFECLQAEAVELNSSDFDPPHGGYGALFPLCSGMLQAANIKEDLISGDVITAHGRTGFVEAVNGFGEGDLDARLLESLACDGCIMGAGMSSDASALSRRTSVSAYVRDRIKTCSRETWQKNMERYSTLDLTRQFACKDQRLDLPSDQTMREILERMGKHTDEDELDCGACGYESCRAHADAIYKGLAEKEMCLPYTIDLLQKTVSELADSNSELSTTQEALMHSEKLASMGQLAAGIAHEVNNPLGVVLMYAHLMRDNCTENSEMREDAEMIAEQADRCKKIVSGLLNFARQNKVLRKEADVLELLRRSVDVVPKPSGIEVEVVANCEELTVHVDWDQMLQVLTNLISNAYGAMGETGTLTLECQGNEQEVILSITDTGCGIAEENRKRVFEPFFTTKQIGKGTGLGLSVAYGIIKMHRGNLEMESNNDPALGPTGTTFRIQIPLTTDEGASQ